MSHRLPCEFIQDLLPLYIDGITGRVSDGAIREHIAGCSKCREMLEQMQRAKELQEALDRQQEIRDIDYMKKVRAANRRSNAVLVIILALMLLVPLYFAIAVSSPIHITGEEPVTVWGDSHRSGFEYDGEEYILYEGYADGIFEISPLREHAGEDPAFEIKKKSGPLRELFNIEIKSVMYRESSGAGFPVYICGDSGKMYCSRTDKAALDSYYSDMSNYRWQIMAEEDGAFGVDVKFTGAELEQLAFLSADMADCEIRDDANRAELSRISDDRLGFSGVELLQKDGVWYWSSHPADRSVVSQGCRYMRCCLLPDSINDKINKAYKKSVAGGAL